MNSRHRNTLPTLGLVLSSFSLLLSGCASFYNSSSEDPTSLSSPSPTPGPGEESSSVPGRLINAFQVGNPNDLETSSADPIDISLSVSGAENYNGTPCSNLSVLSIPSNPSLFDSGSFTLIGTYPNCTLQITPAAGQCGTSSVNLSLSIPGQASDDITLNYTASGRPYVLSIENAPDGIGTTLAEETLAEATTGATFVAYSVVRNQCGDFVQNQSVLWDLSPTVGTSVVMSSALGDSTTLFVTTTFAGPRPDLPIPLTVTHADYPSVSATIAYHYANADLQLWLDAQATQTLFQDIGETTAASATNDPVRLWKDRSGYSRHASQWSETRKPALDASGSHPSVAFTKDCLKLGSDGEDFGILDSDAFTIAFVVARKNNPNAPSMNDSATYPIGRYMPLLSMQDFTLAPAEGLLRIVANNAYAVVTQYRTNRETPGQYWFSSNSITNNGNQCFGNTGNSAATCTNGNASEATQVFVTRGDVTRIQQQILKSGTTSVAGLGATDTAASITAMRNSASSSFPTFLGCDYDQSASSEYDGIYGSGASATGHFPFTGSFSEVIIYNRYLTDADTVTLINGLADKWDL